MDAIGETDGGCLPTLLIGLTGCTQTVKRAAFAPQLDADRTSPPSRQHVSGMADDDNQVAIQALPHRSGSGRPSSRNADVARRSTGHSHKYMLASTNHKAQQ